MTEAWRPVVGYESLYEVSDHGRIRSLDRVVVCQRGGHTMVLPIKGRVLKQFPRSKTCKYLAVTLHNEKGGTTSVLVHTVVAAAYIGPRPKGMHILHRDDVHDDNRASRLRYGTPSENEREKKRQTMCRKGLHVLPETDGPRRCDPCYRDWYERTKAA